MRYNRNIAAVILVAATVLLLATSLYITPATVSDADPSTYVIVPTLMLPLFLLFSLKNVKEPALSRRDLLIGVSAFAIFILLTVAARLYFTVFFVSFRVDMLLMPLALVALISLLFGTEQVARFRGALIYSLLASPLVLYPLLAQFNVFTQVNSQIVYSLIKPLVQGVRYSAPITISANGYSIGIGQACVSIGIFISLALFLIPVAYFYDGKTKKKVLWVASGVALLFVLNIARMLGISSVWLAYGPNATTLFIHEFIGVILFYVCIAALILTAGFFGLHFKKTQRRARRHKSREAEPIRIAAAIVFPVVYLLLTLNYSTALALSPLTLGSGVQFNYSNPQIASAVQSLLSGKNFSSISIASQNGTSLFLTLSNSTINETNPMLLFLSEPNATFFNDLKAKNQLLGEMSFFNNRGAEERVLDLMSNSTEFLVYNSNVWLQLPNATSVVVGAYLIIPSNDLPHNATSCGSYDALYSWLYNLPSGYATNQSASQKLLDAECASYNLLWR